MFTCNYRFAKNICIFYHEYAFFYSRNIYKICRTVICLYNFKYLLITLFSVWHDTFVYSYFLLLSLCILHSCVPYVTQAGNVYIVVRYFLNNIMHWGKVYYISCYQCNINKLKKLVSYFERCQLDTVA